MASVLWICGPIGVGKTEVGWRLYTELVARDEDVGYVDIDQLGICYPEPADDPGRFRLKSRNLALVAQHFASAGVRTLIVSGVVDAHRPVTAADLDGHELTLCRLRADRDVLEARLLGRGATSDDVRGGLEHADLLDELAIGDACIDTTHLAPEEVVRELTALVRSSDTSPAGEPTVPPSGDVLWFSGPLGVGTSTVGFAAYLKVLGTGTSAAYVDAEQLGFCARAPEDHELRGRLLTDLWQSFRRAGAERLVVVGPFAEALTSARVTCVQLRASDATLAERVARRVAGEGWRQPGDPLRGRYPDEVAAVVEQARRRDRDHGERLDTDDRSVDDLADEALRRAGWRQVQP